ncbi:MAG: hypothetical protein Q4G36_13400 [Paracoccus sp. (in: a-proteobacteria)]|nr:hypothetical protein [Paracoccus sp. (in: a-proteobacteria)]
MTRFAAALAFTALTSPALANNACAPGAVMAYPIEDVVLAHGRVLAQFDHDYGIPGSPNALNIDTQPEIADLRADFLADEHHLRRDAILLARLAEHLGKPFGVQTLTTVTHPDITEAMVEALDNSGQGAAAALMRQADAFFDGETYLRARRSRVDRITLGTPDDFSPFTAERRKFRALEDQLTAHRDAILEAATDLFMSDPELGATIEAEHSAKDRDARLYWALWEIMGCTRTEFFAIIPEVMEALPQTQRDLLALFPYSQRVSSSLVADYFNDEAGSPGRINPPVSEIIDAMDRNGLADQADALRGLQDIFLGENGLFIGEEMDTRSARLEAAYGMDEDTEDRVYELLEAFRDGAVWDGMIELAISSSFMPELAEAPE